MLHTLKTEHLGLILQGFAATIGASDVTVNKGSNDTSAAVRNSAGNASLTRRETGLFKRGPIAVASPGADVAEGGLAIGLSSAATGDYRFLTSNSSGIADDGDFYAIGAGWINEETDLARFPQQHVRATFPHPVLMGFSIGSDGSIVSGGNQATVTKTGTGTYRIDFSPAMGGVYGAVATGLGASNIRARIVSATALSVTVNVSNASGTLGDNAFHLLVLASKSTFETGRMRKKVHCPQPFPRLLAGRFDGTGTAAIVIGGATNGASFELTDNGTGDYTVTFTKPFKRAPIVIPTTYGLSNRSVQLAAAPSVSSCNILGFDISGTAADADFDLLVLGYDSELEQ